MPPCSVRVCNHYLRPLGLLGTVAVPRSKRIREAVSRSGSRFRSGFVEPWLNSHRLVAHRVGIGRLDPVPVSNRGFWASGRPVRSKLAVRESVSFQRGIGPILSAVPKSAQEYHIISTQECYSSVHILKAKTSSSSSRRWYAGMQHTRIIPVPVRYEQAQVLINYIGQSS